MGRRWTCTCTEDKVGVKAARRARGARAPRGRGRDDLSGRPTPSRARSARTPSSFCARRLRQRDAPRPRAQAGSTLPPSSRVLPKILETDRVVQYYAWPVGTVVRAATSPCPTCRGGGVRGGGGERGEVVKGKDEAGVVSGSFVKKSCLPFGRRGGERGRAARGALLDVEEESLPTRRCACAASSTPVRCRALTRPAEVDSSASVN